jgi:hypothetical protein
MTTTHLQIVKALKDLGVKEYTLSGDDIENIIWLTDEKYTKAQIQAAIANPLPEAEPTVQEKLASVGLNINDLKAALGL